MIRTVFDCNVIVSGIGWNGSARRCLRLAAQRQVFFYATGAILEEYEAVVPVILTAEVPEVDFRPSLRWVLGKARRVEATPLGRRRSRDAKDDIYLACALAASAQYIVTYDNDLLDMKKPFGIEIVRPGAFLRRCATAERPHTVFVT